MIAAVVFRPLRIHWILLGVMRLSAGLPAQKKPRSLAKLPVLTSRSLLAVGGLQSLVRQRYIGTEMAAQMNRRAACVHSSWSNYVMKASQGLCIQPEVCCSTQPAGSKVPKYEAIWVSVSGVEFGKYSVEHLGTWTHKAILWGSGVGSPIRPHSLIGFSLSWALCVESSCLCGLFGP